MKILKHVVYVAVLLLASCGTQDSGRIGNGHSDGDSTYTPPSIGAIDSLLQNDEMGNRDRENWQKPQMVISRLGDLSDKTVADIGAGTGYFSMRLARKAQKVIAIDIEEEFLAYINRRISSTRDGSKLNVETRLTVGDDPKLEPGEADLVLIVNTYPYIGNRVQYLRKVKAGMAEGGQLVVIDFKKHPLPVGPDVSSKLPHETVQMEIIALNDERNVLCSWASIKEFMSCLSEKEINVQDFPEFFHMHSFGFHLHPSNTSKILARGFAQGVVHFPGCMASCKIRNLL